MILNNFICLYLETALFGNFIAKKGGSPNTFGQFSYNEKLQRQILCHFFTIDGLSPDFDDQ